MFPREPPSSLEVGQRRGRRACRSRPAVQGGSADGATLPADPLRGRLMVGRLTLDQEVGVRVPAPQLRKFRPGRTDSKPGERKGGGSRRVRTGPRTEGSRLRRIDANHSFELGRVAYHCRYSPCLRLRLGDRDHGPPLLHSRPHPASYNHALRRLLRSVQHPHHQPVLSEHGFAESASDQGRAHPRCSGCRETGRLLARGGRRRPLSRLSGFRTFRRHRLLQLSRHRRRRTRAGLNTGRRRSEREGRSRRLALPAPALDN